MALFITLANSLLTILQMNKVAVMGIQIAGVSKALKEIQ